MKYLIFFALAAALSLLGACKKNNPCEGRMPLSADFGIYHSTGDKRIPLVDTDSMYIIDRATRGGGHMMFRAHDDREGITYHWKVGSDQRYWIDRDLYLRFENMKAGDKVPITLTVSKAVDFECFPADSATKQYTRYLCFVYRETDPRLGTFEGYHEHAPGKKHLLTLGKRPDPTLIPEKQFYDYTFVTNLCYQFGNYHRDTAFFFESGGGCDVRNPYANSTFSISFCPVGGYCPPSYGRPFPINKCTPVGQLGRALYDRDFKTLDLLYEIIDSAKSTLTPPGKRKFVYQQFRFKGTRIQ